MGPALGQDATVVLRELQPKTQWFVWHVLPTYKNGFPRHREELVRSLRERSIISINERVTDISKRHMQRVLAELGLPTSEASAEGPADEKLFLKSNHNFGGRAERLMSSDLRDYFGVALPHELIPAFSDYRMVERRMIRPAAFDISDVFLERFIGNASEVFYRAFISFDAVVLSRMVCGAVIKKARIAEEREDYFLSFQESENDFASAPDPTARMIMDHLNRFRFAFGFDLGAIDVLLDDDEVPYIIDANPTAWGGKNLSRPGLVEYLRKGVLSRKCDS